MSKKQRIYISGCSTAKQFNAQRDIWRALNCDVVNTFDNNDFRTIKIYCIERATTLFLTDDWQNSKKARIEREIAEILGINIFYNNILVNSNKDVERVKKAIEKVMGLKFYEYAHIKKRRANNKEFDALVLFAKFSLKYINRYELSKLLKKGYSTVTYYINYRGNSLHFRYYEQKIIKILESNE